MGGFNLATLYKHSFMFWNDHIKHAFEVLICITKKSEKHGKFPEDWKKTNMPLYKKNGNAMSSEFFS